MDFILGKSEKFDADYHKVMEIFAKETITHNDRLELLKIYAPSWHTDGKIEGIMSYDSSCNHCKFCKAMIEASGKDPTIICGECYDYAQERYKINSLNRHGLNLLIFSNEEFTEDELATIESSDYMRANSSGETPNVTYAKNMLRLFKVNEKSKCGYWAKNTAPVSEAVKVVGKPKNVKLIQSSIHIGKPAKLADGFDYTFTVYPDEESVRRAIAKGSSPCNGLKCKTCGKKCYEDTHNGTDIAELLRGVNKAKRAELVALCQHLTK